MTAARDGAKRTDIIDESRSRRDEGKTSGEKANGLGPEGEEPRPF